MVLFADFLDASYFTLTQGPTCRQTVVLGADCIRTTSWPRSSLNDLADSTWQHEYIIPLMVYDSSIRVYILQVYLLPRVLYATINTTTERRRSTLRQRNDRKTTENLCAVAIHLHKQFSISCTKLFPLALREVQVCARVRLEYLTQQLLPPPTHPKRRAG